MCLCYLLCAESPVYSYELQLHAIILCHLLVRADTGREDRLKLHLMEYTQLSAETSSVSRGLYNYSFSLYGLDYYITALLVSQIRQK